MYQNRSAIADISIKYNNLIPTNKNENHIFYWCKEQNKSKLYGFWLKNKQIQKQEFMYIHLQKRAMKVNTKNENEFLIVPNSFIELPDSDIEKVTKKYYKRKSVFRKEYIKLRLKRLVQKIFRKGKKTS